MNSKLVSRSLPLSLLAAPLVYADYGQGFDGYDHNMMWGVGLFGGFMMLLFWGAIITLVVIAVRSLLKSSDASSTAEDALELLKQRYAKGEIDEDEYRKRKSTLEE